MVRRNVTHRDVAEKAGVSATTVSFVLNGRTEANISEETKQRVLEAAEVLGYVPNTVAQALARGRTQTFGLILGEGHYAPSFVWEELVSGVLSVTRQNNFRLLVDRVGEKDHKDSYLRLAQAKSIDGLILPEPSLNNTGIHYLSNYNFPVVVLGHLPEPRLTEIDFDNVGGARAVVEHLLALGHTQIACITHMRAADNLTSLRERLQGYKEALAAANIPFNKELVRYGVDTEQSGYENMLNLLDEGPAFSAVFALNDAVALGAMAAIQTRGLKIPQSIAVAGFDDNPFAAYLNPPLTSVKLPFEELGRLAGQMLVNLINEQAEPGLQVTVPVQLVIRKSTDPKI